MHAGIDAGRLCRLHLAGEVDMATVDGLIALGLYCLKQATVDQLVIDLGALVVLNEAGRDIGKTVALASPPPGVQRVLNITRLDRAFVVPSAGASRVMGSPARSRRSGESGLAADTRYPRLCCARWCRMSEAFPPLFGIATGTDSRAVTIARLPPCTPRHCPKSSSPASPPVPFRIQRRRQHLEQMKDAAQAMLKGDENRRGIVKEGVKTKV